MSPFPPLPLPFLYLLVPLNLQKKYNILKGIDNNKSFISNKSFILHVGQISWPLFAVKKKYLDLTVGENLQALSLKIKKTSYNFNLFQDKVDKTLHSTIHLFALPSPPSWGNRRHEWGCARASLVQSPCTSLGLQSHLPSSPVSLTCAKNHSQNMKTIAVIQIDSEGTPKYYFKN